MQHRGLLHSSLDIPRSLISFPLISGLSFLLFKDRPAFPFLRNHRHLTVTDVLYSSQTDSLLFLNQTFCVFNSESLLRPCYSFGKVLPLTQISAHRNSVADSFWYLTKLIQFVKFKNKIKKIINIKKKKKKFYPSFQKQVKHLFYKVLHILNTWGNSSLMWFIIIFWNSLRIFRNYHI